MNNRRIIYILIGGIFILGIAVLLLLAVRNNSQSSNTTLNPTGIIIPTNKISPNTLDIVSIDPKDQTQNVSLDKKIIISFSKTFSENEIQFSITPNTPHSTSIEGNNLVISPSTNWEAGTHYGFSINFTNDNQKVRLYEFTTTGPTQEYLPDTQPSGLYEQEQNTQRDSDPNLYVSNQTPYESSTFYLTSEFESNPPAHFYIIVHIKDTNTGQADFNAWLQSLNLTQDQINSLDVRYQ
jgi:hypothetical protein